MSDRAVAAVAFAAAVALAQGPSLIRETRTLTVAGHSESWTLRWKTAPQPACAGDMGATCPCTGFTEGERGDLELVRSVAGHRADRLPLTPFFEEAYTDWLPAWGPTAIVQRWNEARRSTPIMELRDYDHDGAATEFFLQTVARPCGKRMGVVLGVSQRQLTLHAFTSAAHPERPLVLRIDQWEAVSRADVPITSVDWACGDHAADEQEEVSIAAADGRIDVTRMVYACDADAKRGRLLRTIAQ